MLWMSIAQLVPYRQPDTTKPEYYRPHKFLIGPTADVLPGGTFWMYGGAFFMNWSEYGIGQGVFNVGIADLLEVKISLGRILSNLSRGGANELATSMRVKLLNLKSVKAGLELRLAPVVGQREVDHLIVKDKDGEFVEVGRYTREFRSRSATLFVPVTFYTGKWAIGLGASISQYGTTIKLSGNYLPDTSNGCQYYPDYNCEDLKLAYSSLFKPSKGEERSMAYGGYVGVTYTWRPNTDILVEVHALPKILYRTRPTNLSDTLDFGYRWYVRNRHDKTTFYDVVLTFAGVRYSFNRYISAETGLVLPYDPQLGTNALDLLNSMIYANLNVIFNWKDIVGEE